MPKIKTHQSIGKRFKISKTGKMLRRKAGQDHFNARESGSVTRGKRRNINVRSALVKPLTPLIPYSGKY